MLNQLLAIFFDKADPNEEIQQRIASHWENWLAPISEAKPTGEDLTYNDTFQEIKEEIAKLSGIDHQLILTTCETLLKKSSKDIRIATYYCLSRLQLNGAEGFADGLELLAGLLDRFGMELYPSRNYVRKNAIDWLASNKFIDLLTHFQPIHSETLIRITAALYLINSSCQSIFIRTDLGDEQQQDAPDLSALSRLFTTDLKAKPPVKTVTAKPPVIATVETATQTVSETLPSMHQSAGDLIEIRSNRDLLEQARRIATYLRLKPEGFFAAGRFLRVLRWDTISHLPMSDSRGKSRLPAPRAELKQHVSRLAIQQQWQELFERVEVVFMEGANHFWLDLQRYAIMALQKMGGKHSQWADIYLTDIGLMLERLPGIEKLTFDNGMPFADSDTLNWITSCATIHHLDEDAVLQAIPVSGENDWREIEVQARELARKESLEEAFKWLQGLPHSTQPKQRFLMIYTQARVADHLGQREIAVKLLLGLNAQYPEISLLQWEPVLLFDVKAYLLKLLKQKWDLRENDRSALIPQIDKLTHELMQIDPARTLTVM